jgi:hypothetical protein
MSKGVSAMIPNSISVPSLGPDRQVDSFDCVVLILSCDKYQDLWSAVTTLFNRHWPDCPWPKYLASDLVPPCYEGFTPLGAGTTGLDWSSLLQRVLAQLPAEHVLLFLDDFFLTASVDTGAVLEIWNEMQRMHAGHVRIRPHPRLQRALKESLLLGEHFPGLPYRTSLQAGFWRRDLLESLLRAGESPWQFEVYGSARSEATAERFLAAWQNPVPYVDVLERGKWLPRGVRICRRHGLTINLTDRPMISLRDQIRRALTAVSAFMIECLPQSLRRYLRRLRAAGV